MEKIFYFDSLEDIQKTYPDLISDLSNETKYNTYCISDSYYIVFKNIILSLLLNKEIILLDSDFTENEIKELLGDNANEIIKESEISFQPFFELNSDNLIQKINNAKEWKITLFTSGTTGVPKKISHSLDSISRYVKKEEKRSSDVWGFAYNPTHMAGLQVFLQALFNQNSIIRLFGVQRDECLDLISRFKITNISATPTFYRLLLPADRVLNSLNGLTSGGEKFDETTLHQLQKMFPNSKIRNVYASTEAGTLFAAKGNVFTIKPELIQYVKVVDNELYIHHSLMGFSESINIVDGWYATGDLIEILENEPLSFKFISRKSEMINTGGYKVNPNEVEEVIRDMEGVKEVYVYGKKNSLLGNIVCCEIVGNKKLEEKEIRIYLQNKLQEFKIPRIMKFVDSLSITRTGKLSRKQE